MDLLDGLGVEVLTAGGAAVGAGILMGGFLAGAASRAAGRDDDDIDRRVRDGGYIGGCIGLVLLVGDQLMR